MSIDIAIVGVAGRFPQSPDIEQFWRNLIEGNDCIDRFSPEELAVAGVPEAVRRHPDFVPAEPRIPGLDTLDAALFGLTPREARLADPQFRMFLECCHAALENAGLDAFNVPGRVAVFGSAGTPVYLFEHLDDSREPRTQGQLSILNNGDYLATQVSWRLNLTGPAMTVLSACSSSLLATHLAARSVAAGECDLALSGGVSVELDSPYGYFFLPGGVRSRDGHCRPFDASGAGVVFGGGAGVVALKRLADADADGDHIYAVIRGTAVNNDGSGKAGYGAPGVRGQAACIRDALAMAGVRPSQLSLLEAHATGTRVGDPGELDALGRAWRAAEPEATGLACWTGSVKGNIGHAVQAAGVASLIKLALAFDRQLIPPSINVRSPLPQLVEDDYPLRIVSERQDWRREPGRPRRAAVSSFGVGGTNVHMILEEGPEAAPTPAAGRDRIVTWSAREDSAVDELAPVLADHLAATGAYEDSVSTLQRGRTPFQVRRAAVLAVPEDAAVLRDDSGRVLRGTARAAAPAVIFAFPGQGSLSLGAGRQLAADEPRFGAHLADTFALFGDRGDSYARLWRDGDDQAELIQTGNAQPILFALELALARTWRDWGIEPSAVLGHSIGEIIAGTVAGVFAPEEAARLVLARADFMQRMPEGAMVAVFAAEQAVRAHLTDDLDIAAVNGAAETVVGGPREAVARLVQRLRDGGIRAVPLRTSHAFHSRAMQGARDQLLTALESASLSAPRITLISAFAGQAVSDEARERRFWADQLVQPVRFADAVETLASWHAATRQGSELLIIEMGPGQALTGLIAGHPAARQAGAVTVPVTRRPQAGQAPAERRDLLTAAAKVWVHGASLAWDEIDGATPARRVPVPGYRYQRQRFWVDVPLWARGRPRSSDPDAGVPDEGQGQDGHARAAEDTIAVSNGQGTNREPASPFTTMSWVNSPRPAAEPRRLASTLVFLPAGRAAARGLMVAVQQISDQVIPVRPGPGYEFGERTVRLDPGDGRHISRLLADLAEREASPDLVVHATGYEPWPDVTPDSVGSQLRAGFGSLLQVAQGMSRAFSAAKLLVLTTRALDVSGSDEVDPVKAAALGLVSSWPLEDPAAAVRLVDADGRVSEDDFTDELALAAGPPVVALRGARRWIPAEVSFRAVPSRLSPLRRKGTYLITGGLGGLGLELALGLARTGLQPSIVLMSRTSSDGSGRISDAVEEAEDLGASVKVVTADVADERDVRRVLDIVTAQLGPVSGVFHLAGVPGGGVVALRDTAAVSEVMRPKVAGTVMLHDALRRRGPLDFWVSFSSRAAVSGLAGSADYAGANAFLDAYAARAADSDFRMLSINWPSWSQVGMAAAGLAAEAAADPADPTFTTRLDPASVWALAEHKLGDAAVLPGAGHIDLVVRAFRSAVPEAGGPVRLRDVFFTSPLVVRKPADGEVTFIPDGTGWKFVVRSGPAPARVHVRGRIEPAGDVMSRSVDMTLLRDGMPPLAAGNRVAEESRTFTLGPRWRCVRGESTMAERTVIDIRLDEAFAADLTEHPVHPAMLDCATSGARVGTGRRYVPFMYGAMLLHQDVPGHVVSSIRRTRDSAETLVADIDLLTPDGLVIAEIKDFTMRAFDPGAFLDAGPAEDEPDGESALTEDPGRGIAPRTGVALTLQLLGSRTPPQVMVRPFEAGQPVPMDTPWPLAAPSVPERPTRGHADRRTGAGHDSSGDGQNALERMRRVWTDVLGAADLNPDDNFFDIGGNSLSAIEMVARIREEFGTEISIAALLDAPTLAGITELAAAAPGR